MSTLWLGLLGFCAVATLTAWAFFRAGRRKPVEMEEHFWRDM